MLARGTSSRIDKWAAPLSPKNRRRRLVVTRSLVLLQLIRSTRMPEGDTIFRAARTLHRALAGKVVTRFESVFPALTRVADDHPIVGRTIESVAARGKHLLMPHQLARHKELQALGPDVLDSAFDRGEATRRIRAREHDAIGDVLLNQRAIAGIGNVLKSEILFIAGVDPFTPVARLTDADVDRVIDVAREQLAANVMDRLQTLHQSIGRRTTRSMHRGAKLWVYSRGGKPCRRCGATIRSKKTGLDARLTYWCPECQRVG